MPDIGLVEEKKVAVILQPQSINATPPTTLPINMTLCEYVSVFVAIGASAGTAPTISFRAFADKGLTDPSPTLLTNWQLFSSAAAGNSDNFINAGEVTSGQFTPPTTDNIVYECYIKNIEMPDNKPWLVLTVSAPGAATLITAFAVCTARYNGLGTPTIL